MAGASSIPPSTNASTLPVQSGHEGHAPTSSSFSATLNQAIAQQATSSAVSHDAHGKQGLSGSKNAFGIPPSASAVEAHPNHFPMGQEDGHVSHDFQQKMLGVRVYRQQLLASNIANADTPGYKAVDIDIDEAAKIVKGRSTSLPLATSTTGHLPANGQTSPFPLKYHVPYQAAADGNTVEMDIERQKFSENSLMYQFSLDRVSGHFKHLMELLQNLK